MNKKFIKLKNKKFNKLKNSILKYQYNINII